MSEQEHENDMTSVECGNHTYPSLRIPGARFKEDES